MASRRRLEIPVENPATGEDVATVPELGADEVAALVPRARAAQPGWEADRASRAGPRCCSPRARWMGANGERVVETIVGETGSTGGRDRSSRS